MSKFTAIYARVPTDEQSCAGQLPELREHAARVGEPVVEYIEAGVSGPGPRKGRRARSRSS